MKFDPLTKDIYTDKDEFVKTMNCPYKMSWDNLEATSSTLRKCANCDHLIVETEGLTDDDLLKIVIQSRHLFKNRLKSTQYKNNIKCHSGTEIKTRKNYVL